MPQTEEEKKHNKKLYNMKMCMITSKLRSHFREIQFTPEQWNYFRGKLSLQIERFRVRWDLYHKDMTKQHKVKNLQFGFLQTDIYNRHMPDPAQQAEIENDRGKSLYQLFEEAYEKRKQEHQEAASAQPTVAAKRKRKEKKIKNNEEDIFGIMKYIRPIKEPKKNSLKKRKESKKRINSQNEPESKERIEFQEKVMEEVV